MQQLGQVPIIQSTIFYLHGYILKKLSINLNGTKYICIYGNLESRLRDL